MPAPCHKKCRQSQLNKNITTFFYDKYRIQFGSGTEVIFEVCWVRGCCCLAALVSSCCSPLLQLVRWVGRGSRYVRRIGIDVSAHALTAVPHTMHHRSLAPCTPNLHPCTQTQGASLHNFEPSTRLHTTPAGRLQQRLC